MKSVLLLGFNWWNKNARQTQGSCLHKNSYCYKERVISLPKHLFMLKLSMKLLLVLEEDIFREAFLNDIQAQDLKSIFQDPSFQAASFPYFFITHSSHTCCSLSPFFIPFTLHITRPQCDYVDPMQYRGKRRFQGGISIPGCFQESPETLTDLI